MKKNYFYLLSVMVLFASCSHNVKKSELNSNYDVEVVESVGMAPIVDSNISAAKKSSLDDALKNALHLVVGVYVSGDTLVSKSVLIDDEITSKSEGYIEKYEVLKEYTEDNFYKTKIKAYVRKEDITNKIKTIENPVEKIGSPSVYISINDNGKAPGFANNELVSNFKKDTFRVMKDSDSADIIVDGRTDIKFNTSEGLGGFISYSCSISGRIYTKENEMIGAFSGSNGGIGLNDNDAQNNAGINCARKVYSEIKNSIIDFYNQKRIVKFDITNLDSVNDLNELIKYFRNIPLIRTAVVKNYSNSSASIEILLHKGKASDISDIISKNKKINILKIGDYSITAAYHNQ
jgi:hypothetical protein